MPARNVYKEDVSKIELPVEAMSTDRGLSFCKEPQLVLADLTSTEYHKNDRTAIAFKFDSMTVELEKGGVTIPAPGMAISFPYQSDAVGFVIDWRQVETGGSLDQGCYRVKITWSLGGNSGDFYYGSFNLKEWSVLNERGTVQMIIQLNDLVRKQGINYRNSGFAGTLRFKGKFGYMQPNYDSENIIYRDRTRSKVRNEALRTYELRTSYLLRCMTRLIDEECLLVANNIFITDCNADNHEQYTQFPVILNEDESPSFEYPLGVYAKITASFHDKVAYHESKYDGNIQGSDNILLELPTTVTTGSCADATINLEGGAFLSVASGATENITIVDQDGNTPTINGTTGSQIEIQVYPEQGGTLILKTGQITSYRTADDGDIEQGREVDFSTTYINNPFGNAKRHTGTTGGYQESGTFYDKDGISTTAELAFPDDIVLDWTTWNTQTGKVLGYYFGDTTVRTWNDFVDWGAALSVGTFTSGWYAANVNEVLYLFRWTSGLTRSLGYEPFNGGALALNTGSFRYFWTSTTYPTSTVHAPRVDTAIWATAPVTKTTTSNCIATRLFTVSGTTLT